MATIAEPHSAATAAAKAPISTHPAFPAIAALWFAALLGLGSLVLPVALLERLVTVTGIASLVPSAVPPLGYTARVALALSGAIAGALLGLLLARQVARVHAPEPRAGSFDFDERHPRRPISVADELDEGLPASRSWQQLLATKRGSPDMTEENGRSTYLAAVPLPGQPVDQPREIESPPEFAIEPSMQAEATLEPLELGEFAESRSEGNDHSAAEPDLALETLRSRMHTSRDTISEQDPPMSNRESFEPGEGVQKTPAASEPGMFEPASDAHDALPFAPPSLRRVDADSFDAEDAGEPQEQVVCGQFAMNLSAIESAAEGEDTPESRSLKELGLVQLAARLGASLEKRKARIAAQPSVPPAPLAPLAEIDDLEVAEPDDAARAIADFFGPATTSVRTEPAGEPIGLFDPELNSVAIVPPGMRAASLDLDEADDEEVLEASRSLPLSSAATVAAADEDDDFEDSEDDEDGDEYSSLLAMKNPFARQQEIVRVEEPAADSDVLEAAVTFPSALPTQPRNAPVERNDVSPRPFAERSLRDALATLQRMSGSA